MKISRKINWVSSLKENKELVILEEALQKFYSTNTSYFSDIDFTSENWINKNEFGYISIVKQALASSSVCEIGCGNANILKHYPQLASKYCGMDFSESILKANVEKYPLANFHKFEKPNEFPIPNEKFDLVFSVFVIEHVTRPAAFLDECKRILKPGGMLIILCPDFLGQGRMTSQRAGFGMGTSKAKLKKGNFLDALVTLYDNRIRIPKVCRNYEVQVSAKPLFLINLCPVVFEDSFDPDVDAVYVTSKHEICSYLKHDFVEIYNSDELKNYETKKKIIFLQMVNNQQ